MKNVANIIITVGLTLTVSPSQAAIFEFAGVSTADAQFNTVTTQPGHGYYSSFTRINVAWNSGADVYNSRNWSTDSSPDAFKYTTFTITPQTGYELGLSSLTFDSRRSGTGPLNGQVSLFLNGSATPAVTYAFLPNSTVTSHTFDFADATGVAGAEFRFYGYGASSVAGTLQFDNVTAFDAFTPVPEPGACGLVVSGMLLAFAGWRQWNHRQIQSAAP
jgi:hypothetical protein